MSLKYEPASAVSSGLLDPVDPAFRALSGRLNFTDRRHKFNKDSLPAGGDGQVRAQDEALAQGGSQQLLRSRRRGGQ